VWIADADGSNARRIVVHGWSGTLSPDGRWLTYSVPAGDEEWRSYVREVAGGKSRLLGQVVAASWSPDGKYLAVSDSNQLSLLDPQNGKSRILVPGEISEWRGFSFAPDGGALVYARDDPRPGHEAETDLFVVRFSDGKTRQLTHGGHNDFPVWGGGWIAYRHFRFVNKDRWPTLGELRFVRPDGSNDHLFARGQEDMSQAAWGIEPVDFSADGKRLLACYSHEFGCPPVTFTVPDGSRHELSIDHQFLTAVDIASDGSDVLVSTGGAEGPYDLYSIPFEGGAGRLLERDAEGADWAPIPRTRDDAG